MDHSIAQLAGDLELALGRKRMAAAALEIELLVPDDDRVPATSSAAA